MHQAVDFDMGIPSLGAIKAVVCERFGVRQQDLLSRRRPERLVVARQAAYWLARHAGYRVTAIGRAFDDRDHTTILHGVARTEQRMEADDVFAARVRALETDVQGMWGV